MAGHAAELGTEQPLANSFVGTNLRWPCCRSCVARGRGGARVAASTRSSARCTELAEGEARRTVELSTNKLRRALRRLVRRLFHPAASDLAQSLPLCSRKRLFCPISPCYLAWINRAGDSGGVLKRATLGLG